jgi:transcriptional regulator with XRE-family HTH domain
MDRAQLADFLRTRREALHPEDVGLPRGQRRRTGGLRREEVAVLCQMSTDYYSRLEQQRGPRPSEQMLNAIARGLRLSLAERDHLFCLAGHNTPQRALSSDHVNPGLMRILDRLSDTPAEVITGLAETLVQTPPAIALLGNETEFTGMERSMFYRWFTEPAARRIYPTEDHPMHSRIFTADLRATYARLGKQSQAGAIVDALLTQSAEFTDLWSAHEIGVRTALPSASNTPRSGCLSFTAKSSSTSTNPRRSLSSHLSQDRKATTSFSSCQSSDINVSAGRR